jgi:RNA polymerase sigma-70 factor (ECF subfamily)
MHDRWPVRTQGKSLARPQTEAPGEGSSLPGTNLSFPARVAALFDAHFERLFRYMNRLSGEPDLASDVVQEAFVKLYQRGSLPDEPEAWLISVAMNLFRNEKGKRSRRLRLLTPERGERTLGDPPPSPEEATLSADSRRQVRDALERLPERDRQMLLLHGEGYRYREIALALEMNEASVGTLLARARRAFREAYEESTRAR